MISRSKEIATSFFICAVLFLIVLSFGHPVYHSDDDVYVLYLLGGGFGQAPTNLLHYNSVVHPFLGKIIVLLFEQLPKLNWYSAILYLFHFIACCSLLISFEASKKNNLLIFLLLFSVFEAQLLMMPTFSNTALVLAMTGIILLLSECEKSQPKKQNIIIAISFICSSALFRVHTIIPLLLTSSPIFVVHFFKRKFLLVFSMIICGVVILLLGILQKQYYNSEIPNWKTEEAYRQAVFSYYNNPEKKDPEKFKTEVAFLNNGLLWDKEFLSPQKINEIKIQNTVTASLSRTTLYWLLINNRIYFVVVLFMFCLVILKGNRKTLMLNISCLVVLLCLLTTLILFKKLPEYLVVCSTFFYALVSSQFVTENEKLFLNKSAKTILFILIAAIFIWSGERFQKTSAINKEMNEGFICAWKEINEHPDKLFIATDDHFPIDYFSVWHLPREFPFKNLLDKEQLLNNTYQSIYKRFSITGPNDFINNNKVVLVGKKITQIESYYNEVWKMNVHFTIKDSTFNCLEARSLTY